MVRDSKHEFWESERATSNFVFLIGEQRIEAGVVNLPDLITVLNRYGLFCRLDEDAGSLIGMTNFRFLGQWL